MLQNPIDHLFSTAKGVRRPVEADANNAATWHM